MKKNKRCCNPSNPSEAYIVGNDGITLWRKNNE